MITKIEQQNLLNKLRNIRVETNEIKIKHITIDDIDWYINESHTEHFNKYLDYKYSTASSNAKAKAIVDERVYNKLRDIALMNNNIKDEVRFIIFDANNNRIGDIGLKIINELSSIEISYYISEKYINKGYCYKAIKEMLEAIKNSGYSGEIFAVIQSANKPSIKVVQNVGFKISDNFAGKYTNNLVFSIII